MLNDTFTPKMAIIVYESKEQREGLYLERRDIEDGMMQAGVPLTQKCITDIMETITIDKDESSYRIHGAIPSNLLYVDFSPATMKLVWYNPPQKRKAYFAQSLGIKDGEMNIPGLVYVADNRKLRVYAFKGNKPKAKLYHAPFMNVSEDSVCLGNARVKQPKETTYQGVIEYWEEMFWKSEFSHILGGNPIEGNLATLSKHLIETGDKFPTDVLIPSKYALKDLLR